MSGGIRAAWHRHPERYTAIVLAVLTALCVLGDLFPRFGDLPPFDESAYVGSGQKLVEEGTLRQFAWGPLLSALYGVLYLGVQGQESPDWFVLLATAGRWVIFLLFFVGACLCARAFSSIIKPYVPLMLASAWLVGVSFLQPWNSSDLLFMALSAMGLSQLVAFRADGSLKRLAYGSVFVGLAGLTRVDGLVLLFSLVVLSCWIRWRWLERSSVAWWRHLGATVVPAAFLVGGYLVLYGTVTGSWDAGIMARTYLAFEQGQGAVFADRYSVPTIVEGYRDVRALYGTSADNEGSVLRAILGNPGAFLERLAHSLAGLPEKFLAAYGGPLLAALLYFAGRGAWRLGRRGMGWATVVLLGWHLHLLSYFITFWSPRYAKFLFVALTILAAVGMQAAASNLGDSKEKAGLVLALGVVFAWTLLGPEQGAAAVVLLGGIVLWMLAGAWRGGSWAGVAGIQRVVGLVLVVAVAVAAGRLPPQAAPTSAGDTPQERAVVAASEILPPRTAIAALGLRIPVAAKRRSRSLDDLVFGAPSTAAIGAWPALHQVGAVYLGPFLRSRYPGWFDPLADYLRADPRFLAAFADEDSGTILFVRRDVARVMDAWRSETPSLRSDFDVFVLDDLLVYAKESCGEEDRGRRFFVHVVPVDPADLPAPSRERGFENRGFGFKQRGFVTGEGRCIATRTLPTYVIDHVRTGQFLPGHGRFWEGRIEFGEIAGSAN